jgi:hypothetical protein
MLQKLQTIQPLQSVKLVKSLSQKCSKEIYNTLLHLRPCELSHAIFTIKILKHYDRLHDEKTVESFESALVKLFSQTPYPFTWKVNYNDKCEFMSRKKRVLFYYQLQ